MSDFILFAVFPYVAVAVELAISLFRYFSNSYKFSSLSSEFLESKELFWGSVSWHYGLIIVLIGHVIGFLFPRQVQVFGSVPLRLVILEVTALIFGLLALVGLILLIKRRLVHKRIRAVTSTMDVLILVVLLIQVGSGVGIAVFYRWGSAWYVSALVPYLVSIIKFQPNEALGYITGMPFLVKLHVLNAMVIIAILPFTRLVHFLVVPIHYIFRSWQVVIWNWDRKSKRLH